MLSINQKNQPSFGSLSITVVVPTYQRPEYLKNCLQALFEQTRLPEQICVVVREADLPTQAATHEFLNRAQSRLSLIKTDVVKITQEGFMPPVQAGIAAARSDIVAFIDDDSVALPDWLELLESHYQNPAIGGAGGRVIKIFDGIEKKYKPAKVFGKVFWYGRCEGNLYRESARDGLVPVDFFMGSNMSYRREILQKIRLDMRLNQAIAYNYEVDLGLQIKALGFQLIYDPQAKVKHLEATHTGVPLRPLTSQLVYWNSFNTDYIIFKHCGPLRRCVVMLYEFLIGEAMRYGILSLFWYLLRFKKMPPFFMASIKGRLAGIKSALFLKPAAVRNSDSGDEAQNALIGEKIP